MMFNRWWNRWSRSGLSLCTRWLTLGVACVAPTLVTAQSFPARPVTLIVPFAAGGGTDSIARDMAKLMSERLGQPVVVDNRGGAGGAVGADLVAKARADGHTLLFATSTFATHAAISPRLPYDPIKDFKPVALIGRGPLLLVASRQSGLKTLSDLVTLAKSRPQGLNFCSAGEGSINHLAGELLAQKAGVSMTHVPFKGSGPATLELLAGRVDVFVATVPTILSHVQDGKLSVLAVTSATRSNLLPDVPTMKQAGIEGYEVSTWWGLLAPADTPTAIIDQLHAVVLSSAASPLIRERLIREGAEPLQMSPAEFAQTLGREIERWRQMARHIQGLGS